MIAAALLAGLLFFTPVERAQYEVLRTHGAEVSALWNEVDVIVTDDLAPCPTAAGCYVRESGRPPDIYVKLYDYSQKEIDSDDPAFTAYVRQRWAAHAHWTMYRVAVHEFGHHVHLREGNKVPDWWVQSWEDDCAAVSDYACTNIREYTAEAFEASVYPCGPYRGCASETRMSALFVGKLVGA